MSQDKESKNASGQRFQAAVRSPAEKKPFKLRLPPIPNDDIIKGMNLESPELGGLETWKETMRVPARYGENLFFSTVPEIFDADVKYYSKILALTLGLDPNASPEEIWKGQFELANKKSPEHHRWAVMMCWLHREHLNNGWSRVAVAGSFAQRASISPTKILELNFPDSDIWSDDERLSLKFVKAVFTFKMTDELWDACVEAWGVKWILCISALLVHYYGYSVRFEMVGLDRVEGLTDDIPLTQLLGMPLPEST